MELGGSALVTGAGSGIGQACAIAFAKYGVRGLVVADIDFGAAKRTAAECVGIAVNQDFRVQAVSINVTLEESVNQVLEEAVKLLERIDYCVHAAGIGVKVASSVAQADPAEFERMLKVNVTGTFLVTRGISAIMQAQEAVSNQHDAPARGNTRGSIVIIGSASAFVATPSMTQYTTAKHAVLGITKNAALDNAPHGVRVNSICPSWVDTPMVRKAMEDVPNLASMIDKAVPLGRIAVAEEVADAVMFFCSKLASYATGCNMILDGGTTLAARME